MKTVIQTLKDTEKEIAALKKALAEKESLLPGLRLAASLEDEEEDDDAREEDDDSLDMRLRLGESPRKTLDLLDEQNEDVPYSAVLRRVGNDAREARYAIRNLIDRKLATRNEQTDTVHITPLGKTFMKKYRESH